MAKNNKVVRPEPRKTRRSPPAFLLKVTLRGVRPPIWRRIRVAGDLTLRELHHVLQIALGWTDTRAMPACELRSRGEPAEKECHVDAARKRARASLDGCASRGPSARAREGRGGAGVSEPRPRQAADGVLQGQEGGSLDRTQPDH